MDEKKALLERNGNYKRQTNSVTRILVLLFAVINTVGLYIPGSAETQYIYAYLKKHDNVNETVHHITLNYSNSCGNSTTSDESTQSEASKWSWYITLVEYGLAVPVLIFMGPLVDKFGRKPMLLYNIMAIFISFVIKTISIYFDLNLVYFLLGSAVEGLGGSFYTFNLASLSILADTTTKGKERTFVMALFEAVLGIGAFLSYVGTGYLIQLEGYLYPFVISTCIYLAFFILIVVTLKDTWVPPSETKKMKICSQFFSLCTETINIKHQLKYFLTHMLIFLMVTLNGDAFTTIRTLFTLGMPFCWSPEYIGWYTAISDLVLFTLGTIVLKMIHLLCTSVKDEWIVIMGCLSSVGGFVFTGLAESNWMLYGATVVSILQLLPNPLLKGIMSRIVHPDKQGVLFSNIYLIEIVCGLGGSTLFNNIYQNTVTIYSGLVFLVMAACPAIAMVIMLYAICTLSDKANVGVTSENPGIQQSD